MKRSKEEIIEHNTKMWKILKDNYNITSVILICTDGWRDCVAIKTSTHNTRLMTRPCILANGINEYIKYVSLTKKKFKERYLIPFE